MTMSKTILGAVAGIAALFAGAQANAGVVLNQGQDCKTGLVDCVAVAADRSNLNAINAAGGQFLSLGAGGSLTIDVTPLIFGGVAVIEVTNGSPNPNFPEAAQFIFSLNGVVMATVDINNQNGNVVIAGAGVSVDFEDPAASNLGGSWTFELTGAFDELTILDTTLSKYPATYASKRTDGFDIDLLTFSTVPEPVTLSLLGAGLMGLGIAARRRRR